MTKLDHPRAATTHVEFAPIGTLPHDCDPSWLALTQRAAEPCAFIEPWFLRAAASHLAPPDDTQVLFVWAGPELIGILPIHRAGRYGRIPVPHLTNWVHFHCFLGTPLVRSGEEQRFWTATLAALDAAPWAPSFLHLNGLVENGPVHRGLLAVRRADTVLRSERAMLDSTLDPKSYYETHVRKKKRKELGRLQARLREQGTVAVQRLGADDAVAPWIDAFLALEASGWKGRAGSALRAQEATRAFFVDALAEAHRLGRLEMISLTLDASPIAMLVNFRCPPGSFSFKIAFDEAYARFSPGVLVQIENLSILDDPAIAWMDSCAVENHSMINSLWAERRHLVRVTVPLVGIGRRTVFSVCRTLERGAALARSLR